MVLQTIEVAHVVGATCASRSHDYVAQPHNLVASTTRTLVKHNLFATQTIGMSVHEYE